MAMLHTQPILHTLRFWGSSFGCALLLLLLVHFGDRQPYTIGGEESVLKRLYLASQTISYRPPCLPSDWVLINVGYDRELTPVNDEYGIPMGLTDITHRGHLTRLLQILEAAEQEDRYKGILLDVTFSDGYFSPYDTLLFPLICRLPHLIVAKGKEPLHPSLCEEKSAPALYRTSMEEGNFVKYPYYDGEQATMATRYYTTVMQGAPLDNWRDMHCMMLPFHYRIESPYDDEGNKTYYNLEADLLKGCTPEEVVELCRGKHLLIGDFTSQDLHDTYIGVQSGPIILLNAIMALQEGKQRVSWWSLLYSLIIYTLACAWIFQGALFSRMHPAGRFRRYVLFVISAIGYNLLLILLLGINWFCFGQFHDACFPELFLTSLFFLCQYRNTLYRGGYKVGQIVLSAERMAAARLAASRKSIIQKIKNMKRRLFSFMGMLLLAGAFTNGVLAQTDIWKILYLNTPDIIVDGRVLHTGDTFREPAAISWSKPRQAMKLLNLSTYKQRLVVGERYASSKAQTLSEYLRSEKSLSTRQGVLGSLTEINAYLSDTFYLADTIQVFTTLPTDDSHFFYASYQYKGEWINKRLSSQSGHFLLTMSLYTIDEKPVPPFDTTLRVYYYDAAKGESVLLTDAMHIICLQMTDQEQRYKK